MMKKTLTVLMLLAMLAAPSFAQMRMNGWGRAVWVPVFVNQDGEARSTLQAPWGEEPDFEFMFTAQSTNIGVDLGILAKPQVIAQAANAKVWWKPNNYFKLHIGLGRVATMRGKVGSSTGGYAYARGRLAGLTAPNGKDEPIVQIDDGDGIFCRFNLYKMGAIMEITPIPGLFIGTAVAPHWIKDSGLLAEDVYKGMHAVVGYEIKDIGLFRVGFIGGGPDGSNGETANAGQSFDFSYDRRLEAAFALTSLPGFLIDLGMKYSLEYHPGNLSAAGFSLENPLYLALGVMYTGIPNLGLGFAADGHFAGTAKLGKKDKNDELFITTSAPQIAFNIYPTYNFGIFSAGLDFTYGVQFGDVKNLNDKQMLGFGAHIQKQYGHGNVRGGIYLNAPMNEGQEWGLSVPVWITYSF